MIKDEGGQSLTEFAVILPIFLLLVCGIFDFGRLMYAYMNMNNVAQETARLVGFNKPDSEIQSFARNYVSLGDPSKLQVKPSLLEANRHSGDYVTVTLEYPFEFVTPIISKLLPAPTVRAASTIRVE